MYIYVYIYICIYLLFTDSCRHLFAPVLCSVCGTRKASNKNLLFLVALRSPPRREGLALWRQKGLKGMDKVKQKRQQQALTLTAFFVPLIVPARAPWNAI